MTVKSVLHYLDYQQCRNNFKVVSPHPLTSWRNSLHRHNSIFTLGISTSYWFV